MNGPATLATRSRKTILLVDDNEDMRDFLDAVVSGAGYGVCEAENGRVALERLESMDRRERILPVPYFHVVFRPTQNVGRAMLFANTTDVSHDVGPPECRE
jgi:CheY-like chemotaxis protein